MAEVDPVTNRQPASLELGVIGNGSIAALVDQRARIVWCCLPRFDADASFCALLSPQLDGGDVRSSRDGWAGRRSARPRPRRSPTPSCATCSPASRPTGGASLTGFLCSLPLIARLLACPRPRCSPSATSRATTSTSRRSPRPARRGRVAPWATGSRPGCRRPPGARRRRDRARPGRRPRATRPRPSSPTCARAAARRRSPSPRPRSRRRASASRGRAAGRRGRPRWPSAASCRRPTSTPCSTNRDTAATEVAQLEAELAVQRLPARVAGGRRRRERAQGRRGRRARCPPGGSTQRDLAAPAAGRITDVFRRVGEIAGPTAPVAVAAARRRLEARRLRRRDRGRRRSRPGDRLDVRCDGCPAGADRHRLLCRGRARVHPAGDLLAREPPEARLPRRGEPRAPTSTRLRARADRRCQPRPLSRPPTRVIDVRAPDQALRRPGGRRRRLDCGAPRRDRRLPRAERLAARPRRSG